MWKPELCVCVFTCRSEQESENKAGLGVRVFVCGGRSEIRPIWFVLQSQIKKESGEGEDGGGGRDSGERRRERDGTSVATRSLKSPAAWQPLQERLAVCAKEKAGATDESVLKKGHTTWRMECRFYTSCFYYIKKKYPMGRVPSGERVMTNIEGTLGFDE